MPGCAWCGRALAVVANQVGRSDVCPGCGQDLRACRQCRHFDETVAKACKEPFAEVPADKDRANFCEFFQVGDGGRTAEADRGSLAAAAEVLFGKKR